MPVVDIPKESTKGSGPPPWRDPLREFELLRPRVVIPVGEAFVGDGIVYVPLLRSSGASTWLNAPENEERSCARSVSRTSGCPAAGHRTGALNV